jgi:DNA-binding HxlR family transcriptional regulator
MAQTAIEPLTPDFFDPSCPVSTVPVLGGRKWSWKVMRCLEGGPRRFTELKVPLRGITPKVLVETLRAMERDGAVSRTEYAEHPPRVEYGLTPLGRSLLGPMDATCAWTREHLAHLLEARASYEAQAEAEAEAEAVRRAR